MNGVGTDNNEAGQSVVPDSVANSREPVPDPTGGFPVGPVGTMGADSSAGLIKPSYLAGAEAVSSDLSSNAEPTLTSQSGSIVPQESALDASDLSRAEAEAAVEAGVVSPRTEASTEKRPSVDVMAELRKKIEIRGAELGLKGAILDLAELKGGVPLPAGVILDILAELQHEGVISVSDASESAVGEQPVATQAVNAGVEAHGQQMPSTDTVASTPAQQGTV